MDVLEAAEDLVEEVLDVLVGEVLLGVDYAVEVSLHELGDDVDIVEVVDVAEGGGAIMSQMETTFSWSKALSSWGWGWGFGKRVGKCGGKVR